MCDCYRVGGVATFTNILVPSIPQNDIGNPLPSLHPPHTNPKRALRQPYTYLEPTRNLDNSGDCSRGYIAAPQEVEVKPPDEGGLFLAVLSVGTPGQRLGPLVPP